MPFPLDDTRALMDDHVFFGGLQPEGRDTVIDFSRYRTEPSGTVLFHHGDAYRGFYLLLEGSVHIYRLSASGRMLVLHVIRPGESFAEVPLFEARANRTYPATAETLEDSTLLFIPARRFLQFVDARPRSCLHMLGLMAQRQREAVRQLDALSLQNVQGRLARHITRHMPEAPAVDPLTMELDVPKSVLAAELGTVPETLSRALRALEEKDLIQSDPSSITVKDTEGLQRMGRQHG